MSIRLQQHNCNEIYYNIKSINDIVFEEQKKLVSVYRENILWNEETEFLKRFYLFQESIYRIPKISKYYQEYSFLIPNYSILQPSKPLRKYIIRKVKLLEELEEQENKSTLEENKNYENILDKSLLKSTIISNINSKNDYVETLNSNALHNDIYNYKNNSFIEENPWNSNNIYKRKQTELKLKKILVISKQENTFDKHKLTNTIKHKFSSIIEEMIKKPMNKIKQIKINNKLIIPKALATQTHNQLISKVESKPKTSNTSTTRNLNSKQLNFKQQSSNNIKSKESKDKSIINNNYFKIDFNFNFNVKQQPINSRNKGNLIHNKTNIGGVNSNKNNKVLFNSTLKTKENNCINSMNFIKDYFLSRENSKEKIKNISKPSNNKLPKFQKPAKISINLESNIIKSYLISEVSTPKEGKKITNSNIIFKPGFNMLEQYQKNIITQDKTEKTLCGNYKNNKSNILFPNKVESRNNLSIAKPILTVNNTMLRSAKIINIQNLKNKSILSNLNTKPSSKLKVKK